MDAGVYEDFIQKDLEFLHLLLNLIRQVPAIESFLSRITSKNPWQDVCLIVWAFFALGCVEIGFSHFWVATMNLSAIFGELNRLETWPGSIVFHRLSVIRRILEVKRPVEYDRRLQPFTDLNAESFG